MSTKLTDYLQNNYKLKKDIADRIRTDIAKGGVTEEELLKRDGGISDIDIVKAKSDIFKIPYEPIIEKSISEDLLSGIDEDVLLRFKAIPFEKSDDTVKFCMADPFDIQAIKALERFFPGHRVLVYIDSAENIVGAIERRSTGGITSEVKKALENVDEQEYTEINSDGLDVNDTVNLQNAPVAKIVDSIFAFAIKNKVSDIHIEPMENRVRIRYRIHGLLTEKLSLPKFLSPAVVSRIKIMSNIKIDEKRIPLDGRINLKIEDKKADVRVSTLPTIYGEKVVMRLLESGATVPPLEDSGLRGKAFVDFTDSLKSTNGIILVTGPTGSGKTRTLASSLAKVNKPDVNIITLENPVEIRIPGVTQVQINPDVGLTFALALRAVLRQDPDIVMVGEIRDRETAALAVEASLTGHLVFATLHTNSAAASIPRLLDMGIEDYLLASTLRALLAQRLARRLCQKCKYTYNATAEELEIIRESFSDIEGFDPILYYQQYLKTKNLGLDSGQVSSTELKLTRGKGCDNCNNSGFVGRVGIFEVIKVDSTIAEMINQNKTDVEISQYAKKTLGAISMKQDGMLKAIEGLTTVEEVLRVSKE